eukprot:5928129-Pyramimonas_sp.AAC.1
MFKVVGPGTSLERLALGAHTRCPRVVGSRSKHIPCNPMRLALGSVRVRDTTPALGPGSYLLSGCMGGVGLRLLAYCASQGATHLMLMDRDVHRRRSVEWVRTHSLLRDFFPDVHVRVSRQHCTGMYCTGLYWSGSARTRCLKTSFTTCTSG